MKRVKSALLITMALATLSSAVHANYVNKEQLIKDVTFLASDELKGRASFSAEIDKAADYISNRFTQIGLQPLNGNDSFKQSFNVHQISVNNKTVVLDGQTVDPSNVTVAMTSKALSWDHLNQITTHFIAADQDMREKLRSLNQQGGNHLVLLSSAQSRMFKAYKRYFDKGLNKLALKDQGAIVLVLSDKQNLENINIQAQADIKTQQLTNVVAVLPGESKEQVLFSAHYDHLGTSASGDDIVYNGADDDASGTSAIINLAQYFASKAKPKRTLVFSAFTAEEIGGYGSKYFSEQLDPDNVVAMVNIEMIGKSSKFGAGQVWMTGMERSNLGELMNSLLPEANKIKADPYPKQNLFYRSDNATLARLGVPAHSFSSTQLDKDQHYHKVSDDISSLDLNSMHGVVEKIAVASQGLVDGKHTPTRVDTSKVKQNGKIY